MASQCYCMLCFDITPPHKKKRGLIIDREARSVCVGRDAITTSQVVVVEDRRPISPYIRWRCPLLINSSNTGNGKTDSGGSKSSSSSTLTMERCLFLRRKRSGGTGHRIVMLGCLLLILSLLLRSRCIILAEGHGRTYQKDRILRVHFYQIRFVDECTLISPWYVCTCSESTRTWSSNSSITSLCH